MSIKILEKYKKKKYNESDYYRNEVCSMNLRQLQYAVILSETRSFSQAAEKLNISQPAFSKQIIALEKELGIKLFERTTPKLSVTAAGEFFVRKAAELLFEEDVLKKTIEKYKTGECGKLVIGVAPFRSLYMMPKVVSALKKHFPELQVRLVELGIPILHKGISEGEFDFAIMNLPVEDPELETIPLEKEELVVAIPDNLLKMADFNKGDKAVSLKNCKKIPFATVGENQEMRKMFDKLCAEEGLRPQIYVELTAVTSVREMVREGVAAAVLPKQFILQDSKKYDISVFEIENKDVLRQSAIVMRRGQFVSEYARFAIECLKNQIK